MPVRQRESISSEVGLFPKPKDSYLDDSYNKTRCASLGLQAGSDLRAHMPAARSYSSSGWVPLARWDRFAHGERACLADVRCGSQVGLRPGQTPALQIGSSLR